MQDFTSKYRDLPRTHVRLPKGITFPVKYAVIRNLSHRNSFGNVRRNRRGGIRPHQGWDFYAPINYRCYAIADGTVVAIRKGGAYGLQIILQFDHDFDGDGRKDRLFAAYCHLSSVHVKRGQRVRMGDVIGKCGDSGNARGMRGSNAHLHFEIRTSPVPGRGLKGRMSPMDVFDAYPIREIMVTDKALAS